MLVKHKDYEIISVNLTFYVRVGGKEGEIQNIKVMQMIQAFAIKTDPSE